MRVLCRLIGGRSSTALKSAKNVWNSCKNFDCVYVMRPAGTISNRLIYCDASGERERSSQSSRISRMMEWPSRAPGIYGTREIISFLRLPHSIVWCAATLSYVLKKRKKKEKNLDLYWREPLRVNHGFLLLLLPSTGQGGIYSILDDMYMWIIKSGRTRRCSDRVSGRFFLRVFNCCRGPSS